MKPMTQAEFVGNRGCICPNCRSQETHWTVWDEERGTATFHWHCNDCNAMWHSSYHLAYYDGMEVPDATAKP